MKPTSPLSLLLFLTSVSAIPLPSVATKDSFFPSDCHHNSCAYPNYLLAKPHTPSTKLREPHFPPHQLANSAPAEEPFSNTPLTPPSSVSPTEALSAAHPLSSSYLLSLANPSPTTQKPEVDDTNPLAAKPTSALPHLRKEDARRYWASQGSSANVQLVEIEPGIIKLCGHGKEQYLKVQGAYLAREYSDLLVVGIVVLFLAVVVALEAVERMGDLKSILFGTRQRRGEIYLSDDDELLIVRKPFYLQPAPLPRHKISLNSEKEEQEDEFKYDSDASEKV